MKWRLTCIYLKEHIQSLASHLKHDEPFLVLIILFPVKFLQTWSFIGRSWIHILIHIYILSYGEAWGFTMAECAVLVTHLSFREENEDSSWATRVCRRIQPETFLILEKKDALVGVLISKFQLTMYPVLKGV